MNYDIIISGGGLGGLTAAAKLSKEGKKVLLIEQHDRPGGCATTFCRGDYTMEVGLHEMDGLHPADMKTKIFNDLGLFDEVKFLPVPEFYRFYNGRRDIVIPHDPDEAKDILKSEFPDEKEGIDKYFENVLNARRVMAASRGKKDISIGKFLDDIIGDEDLKLVLLGNLGYFHDDPYSLSYYYYLNAQGSYYRGRANFVQGGSQKLSNALMKIIQENGGDVKLRHLVTDIIPSGEGLSEVKYRTKGPVPEKFTDNVREIIISSSLPDMASEILPQEEGNKLGEALKKNRPGASLLTVYYGFKPDLKMAGNKYYSTFLFDESIKRQADIKKNNHSDFDKRSFTFVDYSQVDSELAPLGMGVGAACGIDYPEEWEGLEKEEYKQKKARVAEQITARLDKLIPGFRDAVDYTEVATSLTVKRYTLNESGAVYGFAQVPGKSSDYLKALPPNMHIASAWGKFGGGFSGAIYSGYMTAMEVLRKDTR